MQAELLPTGALTLAIEAVLFVASESLSIKTLAKLTRAAEAEVTVALQQIDSDYAGRGIVLREIAGGYRFATAPTARRVVEAYLMPPKTNLSAAALETLAIVAYMQPVTKGDIEGIRGVNADSVLSTLVDRRFLAEAGRKDVAGRPILYKTTAEFLEAFGLRSLEELPAVDIDSSSPVELALPITARSGEKADAAYRVAPSESYDSHADPARSNGLADAEFSADAAIEETSDFASSEQRARVASIEESADIASIEKSASVASIEESADVAVIETACGDVTTADLSDDDPTAAHESASRLPATAALDDESLLNPASTGDPHAEGSGEPAPIVESETVLVS